MSDSNKITHVCYIGQHLASIILQDLFWIRVSTIASLRHILMGRNGDYFLNYIDYSKNFDAVLKLLLVI